MWRVIVVMIFGFFSIVALSATGSGMAQTYVSPMILMLNVHHRFEDMLIFNQSDHDAYIKLQLFKMIEQTNGKVKREPFKGGESPMQFGLVVTPAKLIIPPHQMRKVRVLTVSEHVTRDEYYGIDVIPVSGMIEGLNMKRKNVRAFLRVVVAYQPLVIVSPLMPNIQYSLVRKGKTLTVKNTGNSFVSFWDGKQCPPVGEKGSCLVVNGRPVYPGQTWKTTLVYATPVTFTLHTVNGFQKVHSG